ncbi:hypothetical protein Tco_1497197 [Tanacetum coccineum]
MVNNSLVPGGGGYVTYLIATWTNLPEFNGTEFSVRRLRMWCGSMWWCDGVQCYIDGIPDIGVPESRHEGRLEGKGTIRRNDVTPNNHDFEQAHFTVLQNMTSIAPYIHEHLHWLGMGHKRTFSNWLRDTVKSRYPNIEAEVTRSVTPPKSG